MQKQSLTTSCQQTNAQPDSEQRLLWRTSLPIYYKMGHYEVWSTSLVSSGQRSQMCSLTHSQPGMGNGGLGRADKGRTTTREGLGAEPALLSNSKSTAVLPRLSWSQVPNTAPHQLLWRTLTPGQPDFCFSTHLLHSSSELLWPSSCPQCGNPSMQRIRTNISYWRVCGEERRGKKLQILSLKGCSWQTLGTPRWNTCSICSDGLVTAETLWALFSSLFRWD